jgi:hypothetical protein
LCFFVCVGWGCQRPLVPLLLLGPPFFVHWDDQHLLARAMASNFSVAWQCLSKRTISFFCYGSNSTPKLEFFVNASANAFISQLCRHTSNAILICTTVLLCI